MVATVRGQRDIAVGNVVGSDIFNISPSFGASALLTPDGVTVARSALARAWRARCGEGDPS